MSRRASETIKVVEEKEAKLRVDIKQQTKSLDMENLEIAELRAVWN